MLRQFLRHSALYSVGNILTKGVSFLLIPIYLSFLSKEEYGVFEYVLSVGAIVAVVVTFEVSQGVMRFVSEYQGQRVLQSSYIATAFWFTVASYFLLIVTVSFFLTDLSLMLLDEANRERVLLFGALAFSSSALVYFFSVVYRSKLRPQASILISMCSVISIAIFSLCSLYLGYGVDGLLLAQFLAQALVIGVIVWHERKDFFKRPDLLRLKELLSFSAPLVFSSLSVVASIFSDRLFIKAILGFQELAVFSVGAKIAAVITLLTMGVQSALAPLIYAKFDCVDTPMKLRKIFWGYIFFGASFVLAIAVLGDSLVLIIASDSYAGAASVAVVLSAAVFVQGMCAFFPGLSIYKKTKLLACVNVFGAIIAVCLNFWFVHWWGILGASFATFAGACVIFSMNAFFSQFYYKVF
ncbi:oligosaccharide flippase family protein [Pseudomonas sp. PDM14]|uniref:oligosaccharide flippase family protein n=1 Tax=Pseudomonas sp. PDM14 TaxID=2769288 RepID=UPI001784A3C0|nr:oligosaccharide flippase family protein [Pseudomonas sp. PDM14]MBD9484617.1 oligosaccharide flippase family protein [Pseudomonas sp. PDM14]